MKRFLLVTLPTLIFACNSTMEMYEPEPVHYEILRWENVGFSDIGKFDRELENYTNVFFFIDKSLIFRITALEYETVDPNGNPIMASGLVFHPINRKSKGLIEALPIARLGYAGASAALFAAEGFVAMAGYTVILPDLLGFGVSRNVIMAPFLMTENTGRVAYDMRLAATKYLWDEYRYQLPSETSIMGYSSGGSAALAVQKYYETYHSNTIKVKEVFAGGGAYDLPAAFTAFAKTQFSDFAAIPYTIFAFDHFYNLNLDLSQIFIGGLTNYDDWYNGGYQDLDTDLRTYMHADFFKPFDQQNDQLKKLHPYLLENSISEGWRPKAPIYLTHASTDAHVPVECAEAALKKLRKAGANISLFTYPGTHDTVGYLFLLRMLIHFTSF